MGSTSIPPHDVVDLGLAEEGQARIGWAGEQMPVLGQIRERFLHQQPLKGVRVAACLHVTSETANLILALQAGGASTALCSANPLSTQDDVASALVLEHGVEVRAVHGENLDTYAEHVRALGRLGACPVHRRSFVPVREILGLPPLPPWPGVPQSL